MPAIRLTTAEKKIVSAAMKDANAYLKKLDADGLKIIDERELEVLKADSDKLIDRVTAEDARATAAGEKPDLLRGGMTDTDRTMFAVMQGISQYAEKNPGLDAIPVKEASKAVRAAYTNAFSLVKDPDAGGLMGAFGIMFAAMTLPKAAMPIVAQYVAAHADN